MMQSSTLPSYDLSLRDLSRILADRKWWIIGITLFAIIVSAIGVALVKPQWEATVVVQVGAIGQANQVIEPAARVIERVRLKSFRDAVVARSTLPIREVDANLYRRSLAVRILPGSDLIELKVRGFSKESATQLASATVAYLHRAHAQMAAPTVQRMKQLLAQTKEDIARLEAEREKMLELAGSASKNNAETRFMEQVVLANVMIQRDAELRELKQNQLKYEGLLDPLQTYATSAIEKVAVSEQPVKPKKGLIIALAGVAGTLVGVLTAFLFGITQIRRQ